jgi:VWFA-related protein
MSLAGAAAVCLAGAGILAQQPPTFRSGIEVVVIDVTVVTRAGQPVGDLRPGDFTVTVDGKPRSVASAQFLKYETRTTTVREKTAVPAPPAPPAAPPPPRNVLIVIDEDSMEPADGLPAKQAAIAFLDKLAPGDRVGVAAIPRLRAQVTFTTRRQDARKAIGGIIPGPPTDTYEFNIGLAEAFDAERGFSDVIARVIGRECARDYDPRSCPERVKVELRQRQIDAHLRGQRSLDALFALGEAMAGVEGPKTVVLISGGMPMPDIRGSDAFSRVEAAFAAGQASLYTLHLERSFFGRAKKEASPTQVQDDALERDGIENTTSAIGGTLLLGVGALDQYFDRVVTEMSGSYLLGIEVAHADRDGRPHQVEVKVARSGLDLRARKRYVIEPPRAVAAGKKAPPRDEATPAASPVTVEVMTPEAEAAVGRARRYASAYEAELSGLVAEERYVQRSYRHEKAVTTAPVPIGRAPRPGEVRESWEWVLDAQREMKSDYLLVKAPGGSRWLPFRDVFEVDGKKVREREERLQQLFLKAPETAVDRAAEIMADAARYNIGFVQRNVNLPTLALRFLDPAYEARASFRKQGEAIVAGTRTWEMAFSERGSPTLVQGPDGDAPADGAFWIDPERGRVVRSRITHRVMGATIEVTVTYRPDERTPGTWVPADMREVYEGGGRRLECAATYSKIRRFQVSVDDAPKK